MKWFARHKQLQTGIVVVQGVMLLFGVFAMAHSAFAQVMQSGSYQIEFDSLNVAGERSNSASYIIEDTTGEIGTGGSDSASYQLRAGYQQMNETFLSLSAAADVTLLPAIGGFTGGTSTGSTTVTVITDNLAGYQMTIQASSSPAMNHTSTSTSIADYTPVGDPDYYFSVTAGEESFGYSPEGVDIVQRFQNNGSNVCNAGSSDANDACWDGLSDSPVTIAQRGTSNHPAGSDTTIEFQVGIGANAGTVAGSYLATTTITVVNL